VTEERELARRHCLEAYDLIRRKKGRKALRAANAALALDPEYAWAHRLRALALLRLRRARAALASAREAARLEPQGRESLAVLVQALLARRRKDEAMHVAGQLVALAPASPDVHHVLGRVYLKTRNAKEAEAAYRRVLELNPNDAVALNNLGVALRRQAARSFRPSSRRLQREGLRQFAYAAETNPQEAVARRNVFRFSGSGSVLVRWIWLLPYFVLRLGGPDGASNVRVWAERTTVASACALAFVVLLVEALRRRASGPTAGAHRFVREEAARQRWRLWLTAGILAAWILVQWALRWGDASEGPREWLLAALLVATIAFAAFRVGDAVRRRAWRV
jgi:tetratricopeptide (TPR) repeat protein